MKILIATTNPGKFKEVISQFADLGYTFVNLKDVHLDKDEPDEPFDSTFENAVHKARYYGNKSKLLTIAEDTAFHVDFLKGEPGVKAKRFGATPEERNEKVLSALKNVPTARRGARFQTSACLFDPSTQAVTVFNGEVEGVITDNPIGGVQKGLGYDVIFYYPPLKKTFAELTAEEKNTVSHRGQTVGQIKLFLMRYFAFKQIIVPLGIIVKDRKFFLSKRRDTRPDFNNKWEFPGGGVDNGEGVETALKRELREETGYTVAVLEQLPEILTKSEKKGSFPYQVFLVVHVCSIASGKLVTAPAESAGHGWFNIKDIKKLDLLPLNTKCFQGKNLKILKKYID